jgi:maltooligosyltrehalose synthase
MPTTAKYDPQSLETALQVLAANAGNSVSARQQLLERDIDVPESTLKYWRNHAHADRYAELLNTIAPKLEQAAAHTALGITLAASTLELDLIEGLREAHHNGDLSPKDMANALRNVSTTRGISTEKYLLLTGRPTSVTEHRDTGELMRALASLNPNLVIESTATDDTPPKPALVSD